MVFRYRVVPASHAAGPNDKTLPAMPAFESSLDEQVAQLETIVAEMSAEVDAMPEAAAAPGGATQVSSGSAAQHSAAGGALPPPSAYMASCCGKSSSRLEAILGALAETLPEFLGKYRNLNLLLAALRTSAELPDQYRSVTEGLRAFRSAEDKPSAVAALATVRSALERLKQSTAVSMQQELPPVPPADGASTMAAPTTQPGAPDDAAPSTPSADGATVEKAASAAKDSASAAAKQAVEKAAADKVKKGLGGLLPRRKP
jgi:hypothetical protein